MVLNEIVVVGAGAVGTLISEKLRACCRNVRVFDVCTREDVAYGDAVSPQGTLCEALAVADLVVLALPEPVVLCALPGVARAVRATALVVETSSVKSPVEEVLRGMPPDANVIGINPMFAPSLGFSGQAVSVVTYGNESGVDLVEQWLRSCGARAIRLTASRHDQLVATVQTGVHAALLAFGHALLQVRTQWPELFAIATLPFQTVLLLLARILGQSPAVYWDIQASNPFAADSRKALAEGLQQLDALVARPDGAIEFERWLSTITAEFGSLLPELREIGHEVMSHLSQSGLAERLHRQPLGGALSADT